MGQLAIGAGDGRGHPAAAGLIRMVRIVIIIALMAAASASAQTLTCTTSFQGYRVCQGPGGYRSTEWDRGGMRFGEDSDGDRWSTSRWMGRETTTVTPGRE
jgi:hypothetical protein